MPFNMSPSVTIKERDLTSVIPAIAVGIAGTVGQFVWGSCEEIQTISDENVLVDKFGKPNNNIYKDFFSASNFLSYSRNLQVVRVVNDDALNASCNATTSDTGILIKNKDVYDSLSFDGDTQLFVAKYPGALGNSIGVAWADADTFNDEDSNGFTWEFHSIFNNAPEANQRHVVVYDADGKISGQAGSVLETFEYVSLVEGTKKFDGSNNYIKTVINNGSKYIYTANLSILTTGSNGITLGSGSDGSQAIDADYINGWTLFQNDEEIDVRLLVTGGCSNVVKKWVIDNIAEVRKDCVAFVSPAETDCVGIGNNSTILSNIQATRTSLGSSSYAFMDSAYKYQYDKYNDVNRWVPLNGDIAGLRAKTSFDFDPWYGSWGYNNGRIKNIIKFSWTQNKTFRDELFKISVNPVVLDKTAGAVLLGDKTLLSAPSAFDALNVRMLFIVLEKAIATSAKYRLSNFNDEFERNQFINEVEPYLREVQGRRGIQDFRVICDETNNTPEVIDSNQFVGTIAIKPNRSIRNIILNFVAVRTGVSFEEIFE